MIVLTCDKHDHSPEYVFPNDTVLAVQKPGADVLVPQDVDGDVAG